MGKSGGLLLSINRAASRDREPRNSLSRSCGRSIRCPTKSQPGRPHPWAKFAQPRAPAVLVEIGYHDNYADAVWVEGHMEAIAQQLARALTRYFDLPFIYPAEPVTGTVAVSYGTLNLREYPVCRRAEFWPICPEARLLRFTENGKDGM